LTVPAADRSKITESLFNDSGNRLLQQNRHISAMTAVDIAAELRDALTVARRVCNNVLQAGG